MHAQQQPEVAYVPERDGHAWRGEVIDVHSKKRLARTHTTYAHPADATSAATSLWRAKQAALMRLVGANAQAVSA